MYKVRIIPIREFLKTNVSGEVDLDVSRQLLKELMAVCAQEDIDRVLIDGREAHSHVNAVEVWTLAQEMDSLGVSRTHRVAVVAQPKDDFDRTAFFELCATNRGYQLKAFREFEAAMTWLAGEQEYNGSITAQ